MNADTIKLGFQNIVQITNSPVMFAVKDGTLYLAGHTETVTVIMTTSVDHDDFHYVLPPEHVRQIAKTIKKGDVFIEPGPQDDNMVCISGRSRAVYTTMPTESVSYKLLSMYYKEDFLYKISGEQLIKAFNSILAFSVSDVDDQRVKNLHFSIENDVVEVAASNNFTLAKYSYPSEENFGKGDFPLTIVSKSLAFLSKTFGEYIWVGKTDTKMYYKGDDGTFTYKVTLPLVDVVPFKYRDLFNALRTNQSTTEIILNTDEFIEEGKGFLYFTDEDTRNRVQISYSPSNFSIEGNNSRGSFNTDITPVNGGSATGSMFISLDYLTKAANSVASPEIKMKVVMDKVLIEDNNFSVVVPPLRN